MDRIVIQERVEIGKEVSIEGPPLEALRFEGARAGSLVTLTDARGDDFRGRVVSLSEKGASILIFDLFPSPTESLLEIILLQALPEKERMEWIIQKATELGASAVLPFKSERSISLKERESKQKKAHRWQHIAIKAVEQSRRARVPWVGEYCSFAEALDYCKEKALKMILWEREGEKLKVVLKQFFNNPPPLFFEKSPSLTPFGKGGLGGFKDSSLKIYAMVGPEGGFTEGEVMQAKERGFIPVKLGQRILRTETAAITLVGILQYELGDLS
jgi:16S rRNA (uracil1498-N3)-methyltransferase